MGRCEYDLDVSDADFLYGYDHSRKVFGTLPQEQRVLKESHAGGKDQAHSHYKDN